MIFGKNDQLLASAIAAIASTTTGQRKAMQASCRPLTTNSSIRPVAKLNVILFLRDAGSRFDSDAEHHGIAVRDTAVDSARPVGSGFSLSVHKTVVMLRTFHTGCGESVAELDAPHRRNRKCQVSQLRFERIEERLAQSDGHLVAGTLDDPAYGIQLPERAVDQLVPERRAPSRPTPSPARNSAARGEYRPAR